MSKLKRVTFISYTNTRGGAGKASLRIYNLLRNNNLNLEYITVEKNLNGYYSSIFSRIINKSILVLERIIFFTQKTKCKTKHSINLIGNTFIRRKIKDSSIVHLHWVNNETIGIHDFKLLTGKAVITLHDEWLYCGCEHYAINEDDYLRVREGYSKKNKNIVGIDLNKKIWDVKKRYIRYLEKCIITVPSTWMFERAKNSELLKYSTIRVVPNPIDTEIFKNRGDIFNKKYNIGNDNFVIAYGAVKGKNSHIKGFDLLERAFIKFTNTIEEKNRVKILIFGGEQKKSRINGVEVFEVGHVSDEISLSELYSFADITIVPSILESFGQVAAESLSCETPVLCYKTSGLVDIVKHKETGYLSECFSVDSLCEGIKWFYFMDNLERRNMGIKGRKYVIEKFSHDVIYNKLTNIYKEISS